MRSPRLAIFLALFGLYLVTGSREALWADSKAVYLAAENFVRKGKIDIGYSWPEGVPPGRDGKFYSVYPAIPSIVQLPGAALQDLVRRSWPKALVFWHPITSHISCAAFAALTCVLFFGICRRLGVSPVVASGATLTLGLATLLCPYAHDPFSESLQAAAFTGFVGEALEVDARRARGVLLGVWGGVLVNCKLVFVVAIAGAGLALVARMWDDKPRLLRTVAWAAAGFAPFVAMTLLYTWWRWGTFTEQAVKDNEGLFREHFLFGLYGLFLSLGKGVFRYSPPLLVSLAGVPLLWRKHRRVAVYLLAATGPVILVYAKYSMWPGDHAWGPRYLVFAQAVLMVPGALLVDDLVKRGLRRWHQAALALVVASGVGMQILGGLFWRGHWIRIAREVDRNWLGVPDKRGSVGFEEFYPRAWLPPFDPIQGHLWLARHQALGHDARTAESDAPWRRYTTLDLIPGEAYRAVQLDWWGFLWIRDHKETPFRVAGGLLLLVELALCGAGTRLWWRAVKLSG